jgi:hypothetical protein
MPPLTGTASNPGEIGVFGESAQDQGVRGTSHAQNHAGMTGTNDNLADNAGPGVFGESLKGEGVRGVSHSAAGRGGVVGTCDNSGPGVFGESQTGTGVFGVSHGGAPAVTGQNDSPGGIGVFGKGGRLAGQFVGDVEVTGDIRLTGAADCAEDFEISGASQVEPGTVMVLGSEGALFESWQAYDKRVAGVISGAGDYKTGIVLDKQQTAGNRQPVALMGKVYCKVDAQFGAVEVGDLLTSSPTPGHAMKTTDPHKAVGAVIGKALRSLKEGQGLIPMLITLQ